MIWASRNCTQITSSTCLHGCDSFARTLIGEPHLTARRLSSQGPAEALNGATAYQRTIFSMLLASGMKKISTGSVVVP
jgi:hypothetical protein